MFSSNVDELSDVITHLSSFLSIDEKLSQRQRDLLLRREKKIHWLTNRPIMKLETQIIYHYSLKKKENNQSNRIERMDKLFSRIGKLREVTSRRMECSLF